MTLSGPHLCLRRLHVALAVLLHLRRTLRNKFGFHRARPARTFLGSPRGTHGAQTNHMWTKSATVRRLTRRIMLMGLKSWETRSGCFRNLSKVRDFPSKPSACTSSESDIDCTTWSSFLVPPPNRHTFHSVRVLLSHGLLDLRLRPCLCTRQNRWGWGPCPSDQSGHALES